GQHRRATRYPCSTLFRSTLRVMENCWVTREGALAIRPALRSVFAENNWVTTNYNARIVGSFETFFLNDGTKALLFATKESGGNVDRTSTRLNSSHVKISY